MTLKIIKNLLILLLHKNTISDCFVDSLFLRFHIACASFSRHQQQKRRQFDSENSIKTVLLKFGLYSRRDSEVINWMVAHQMYDARDTFFFLLLNFLRDSHRAILIWTCLNYVNRLSSLSITLFILDVRII